MRQVEYAQLPRGWRATLPDKVEPRAQIYDGDGRLWFSLGLEQLWDFAEMLRAFDRQCGGRGV